MNVKVSKKQDVNGGYESPLHYREVAIGIHNDQIRFNDNGYAIVQIPTIPTDLQRNLHDLLNGYEFNPGERERVANLVDQIEVERYFTTRINLDDPCK